MYSYPRENWFTSPHACIHMHAHTHRHTYWTIKCIHTQRWIDWYLLINVSICALSHTDIHIQWLNVFYPTVNSSISPDACIHMHTHTRRHTYWMIKCIHIQREIDAKLLMHVSICMLTHTDTHIERLNVYIYIQR